MTDEQFDSLVMSFASAIRDDPGPNDLRLARSLIILARKMTPLYRLKSAMAVETLTDAIIRLTECVLNGETTDASAGTK